MDIGSLKKESDLSFDIAVAKRNALEKANSRLVVVYKEHIFRADAQTINLVKNLEQEHAVPFFILDTNNNCLLYTSPSPRDVEECRMPSSA